MTQKTLKILNKTTILLFCHKLNHRAWQARGWAGSFFFCFLLSALVFAQPTAALQTIRDSEIEETLQTYLAPLLDAAGMPTGAVEVVIVQDNSLNAFVAGGQRIFFHTGLLIESDTPEMVQGVLAHELGHITGGHVLGIKGELEDAMLKQGITTLLAALAGAATGSSDAAAAVMIGGSQWTQAGLYGFTRIQEQAADQAASDYLEHSRIPMQGLLDVMQLLRSRERLSQQQTVPYLRTHPLTRDRMVHLRSERLQRENDPSSSPEQLVARHQRMLAKLRGFLLPPEQLGLHYKKESQDDFSLLAYAISRFRQGDLADAITRMNKLLAKHPDDAFFHELKGQIYYEHGQMAKAREAYAKAHTLRPDDALITLGYAGTMAENPKYRSEMEALLKAGLENETGYVRGWQLLANLYAQDGKEIPRRWALAEAEFASGRYHQAIRHAEWISTQDSAPQALRWRAEDLVAQARTKPGMEKAE
jgi:predicted Zn-dependent protease